MNSGKRYIYFLFVLFVSIVLNTGCKKSSSDNSNPVSPGTSSNPLLGTWGLTKMTVQGDNGTPVALTPQQAGVMIVWVFRSDNTGQITITDSTGTQTNQGTYTYANNTLSLKNTQTGQIQQFPITFTSNSVFTMPLQIDINGVTQTAILEFTKQAGIRWD